MSAEEAWARRVEALVDSLHPNLNTDELGDVQHLINHGEPGEALCSLAWILDGRDTGASDDARITIMELSAGLVEDEHMPPNFRR